MPKGEAGEKLTFKALQTYEDGEVVRWIGPEDADEPAPVVTLTAADSGGGHGAPGTSGDTSVSSDDAAGAREPATGAEAPAENAAATVEDDGERRPHDRRARRRRARADRRPRCLLHRAPTQGGPMIARVAAVALTAFALVRDAGAPPTSASSPTRPSAAPLSRARSSA